ncbi:MAG: isoprenylcysteine carboxylmethyltransferase family protein [Candidatus Omnitrophica bacterium]|nr:isoprenylcysteine carboxylmethyltransferase family protein [Candidatus Omnitrophota bacterium]
MKKRIQIDSTLLTAVIFSTFIFFIFKNLYPRHLWIDNLLDIFGIVILLKAILLRMSARGHKKAHSAKSKSLVTSGPYATIRNPMYLGSAMMGVGFIFLVWPWWSAPLFLILFYIRFRPQVEKEEAFLEKHFESEFSKYKSQVPRVWPHLDDIPKIRTRQVFNLEECFSTKEQLGLLTWPVLAILLETVQEYFIYGGTDIKDTLLIFTCSVLAFIAGFAYYYQKN